MTALVFLSCLLFQVDVDREQLPKTFSLEYAALAKAEWLRNAPRPLRPFVVAAIAQGVAESAHRPDARSPYATGLYQITDQTARQFGVDPALLTDPQVNTRLWVVIMRSYYKIMMSPRRALNPKDPWDQFRILTACFNAGYGNIMFLSSGGRLVCVGILVQRGLPLTADNMLSVLPLVTGKHARETQTYDRRIRRYAYLIGQMQVRE